MWQIEESKTGVAVWTDRQGSWSIDASGGKSGIRVVAADLLACPEAGKAREWFRFAAVDQESLPPVAEQFVRGSELHFSFPQDDGVYGLRLAIEPIRSTPENLVLEVTVAVETALLDTHPKLDLVVTGDEVRQLNVDDLRAASGSSPISISQGDATVAVILGPHDAPFTTDRSSEREIKLRLFGDFLEKGVIRKARPWLVIDRGREIGDPQLRRIWRELSQSPLPLSP